MANEKMTLDQFVQKYGTDGASALLDRLVDDCLDIQECHSRHMRELLNEVSLMADELKEALNSRSGVETVRESLQYHAREMCSIDPSECERLSKLL